MLERSKRRVENSDPWGSSFAHRRLALLRGTPRIAYYYEEPDPTVFRYRVFNMVEALGHGACRCRYVVTAADHGALDLIDQVDVLVVCRAPYTPRVAALITRAKALGKRVLFDIDDLVFDERYAHLVLETIDEPVDEEHLQLWFGRIGRLGATLCLCDGVITTNGFLAERVQQFAQLPTWVIPNFLNTAQLELSTRIRRARGSSDPSWADRVRFGYFSGTPTHNRDFEIVAPALARILHEDPRAALRLVGFVPETGPLEGYRERIETLPWQDFLNLQIAIGEVDVNLVPLRDNMFTNCKSDLKYSSPRSSEPSRWRSDVCAREIDHARRQRLPCARS